MLLYNISYMHEHSNANKEEQLQLKEEFGYLSSCAPPDDCQSCSPHWS